MCADIDDSGSATADVVLSCKPTSFANLKSEIERRGGDRVNVN